jgi:hypothetical protein
MSVNEKENRLINENDIELVEKYFSEENFQECYKILNKIEYLCKFTKFIILSKQRYIL